MSSHPGPADVPPLLDEAKLAALHDDFASTGDQSELGVLLGNFIRNGTEQVGALAAAVAAGDHEAVRQTAHQLTGASRTLGAARVGSVGARLEDAAAAGDAVAARLALGELEAVWPQTRDALSHRVETLG